MRDAPPSVLSSTTLCCCPRISFSSSNTVEESVCFAPYWRKSYVSRVTPTGEGLQSALVIDRSLSITTSVTAPKKWARVTEDLSRTRLFRFPPRSHTQSSINTFSYQQAFRPTNFPINDVPTDDPSYPRASILTKLRINDPKFSWLCNTFKYFKHSFQLTPTKPKSRFPKWRSLQAPPTLSLALSSPSCSLPSSRLAYGSFIAAIPKFKPSSPWAAAMLRAKPSMAGTRSCS
jgi:hypothetical protein